MTCQNCKFRSGESCTYDPPQILRMNYGWRTEYPTVFIAAHVDRPYKCPEKDIPDYYEKACSKYIEK